jgi:hypothetical protein
MRQDGQSKGQKDSGPNVGPCHSSHGEDIGHGSVHGKSVSV